MYTRVGKRGRFRPGSRKEGRVGRSLARIVRIAKVGKGRI
jgi:hypothetical protein